MRAKQSAIVRIVVVDIPYTSTNNNMLNISRDVLRMFAQSSINELIRFLSLPFIILSRQIGKLLRYQSEIKRVDPHRCYATSSAQTYHQLEVSLPSFALKRYTTDKL